MQISAEDAAAVEPWVAWVEGFVAFLLGCLRRWVLARREAGTDAAKRAHADALPCARLLPDGYFTKNLCEVLCKPQQGIIYCYNKIRLSKPNEA